VAGDNCKTPALISPPLVFPATVGNPIKLTATDLTHWVVANCVLFAIKLAVGATGVKRKVFRPLIV
jgi:hypothetical protein